MKILHLQASPRQQASNAWWLSQQIVARLLARSGSARISVRDLHGDAIPTSMLPMPTRWARR
jgi:FMN-dependent NADH-azoreductase